MAENWDNFWSIWEVASSLKLLKNTYISARTKKMEMRVRKFLGSLKGLEVIELGSGTGSQSLVMALKGARVTLVDRSEEALKRAKELFKKFGLRPTYLRGDIFDLNHDFFGKFDISMSFGTVEHLFHDYERMEAVNIHYKLIKEGGVSFISVPNEKCPHHRLVSLLVKIMRLEKAFKVPAEKPFNTLELIRYARRVGFRYYETFGSSLFEFDYLTPHLYVPVHAQITTPLDNFFAHSLTLFGVK